MAMQAPERLRMEFQPEVEVSDIVNVEVNFDTYEARKILWFMDKTGIATYAEAVRALCMCGLGFTIIADPTGTEARSALRFALMLFSMLTGIVIDHEVFS